MIEDPDALDQLLEESQDLQVDAMRSTGAPLEEMTEIGHDRQAHPERSDPEENKRFAAEHSRNLQASLSGAAILGVAGGGLLIGLLASPAFAGTSPDVQMMQTAAAIENLAVSTYGTALTLPYIGGAMANPVVKKFVQVTRSQHDQHNDAFNAAARRLGGRAQMKADPAFVPVVNKAVSSLSGASATQGVEGVVALALELENLAAATYVRDCSHLRDLQSRAVTASIMGVEAQHAAVLRAVQALLMGGAPQLIALSPTVVTQLPAAAGSVGFPNAFYPTTSAASARQGAVK